MAYFARRGERRLTHVAFVALHYPLAFLRPVGLLSEAGFRRRWSSHLPWYFRNYTPGQMRALTEWVAHDFVAPVTRANVLAQLNQHLEQGHAVALVSGAPLPVVEAIAQMWRVPHAIGSPVELKDGRYTARMLGPPCIDAQKAVYVRQYLADRGLAVDWSANYAYADSYSDLGMFEMVGHPVAVCPDKRLKVVAEARGWVALN